MLQNNCKSFLWFAGLREQRNEQGLKYCLPLFVVLSGNLSLLKRIMGGARKVLCREQIVCDLHGVCGLKCSDAIA